MDSVGAPVKVDNEDDPAYKEFLNIYRIQEVLGRGAFSVVYSAQDLKSGLMVAVKVVERHHVRPGILQREVEIMKEVAGHPNILTLYGVWETANNVYIVMELASCGEVFDKVKLDGPYDESDGKTVIRQIVSAVKYLHDHDIAHRDLKPENLLCVDDRGTAIRIADFGLSRLYSQQSMMKTCCGSPSYVAPEVLMDATYSPSVDMWSIGVICYVLLTGCVPFWGETTAKLYKAIQNVEYRWPSDCKVSNLGRNFVRSLLEKDPSRRLSAEAALRHPWLEIEATHNKGVQNTKTTKRLFRNGKSSN